MKITKTWFKKEIEITPNELKELSISNYNEEGDAFFAIINFIMKLSR